MADSATISVDLLMLVGEDCALVAEQALQGTPRHEMTCDQET